MCTHFFADLEHQKHMKGHETIITWTCFVCNEKFLTSEEVEENQRNSRDDSFEKSFSFLARNLGNM